MNTISTSEKLDVLLVLALAFENNFTESDERKKAKTVVQLVEKSLAAMNSEDFLALKLRADFLDNLPEKKQEIWREIRLEKLLRRGKTIRLDENINPVHIINVLSRETKTIQNLILRNLPTDLSQRIAQYLELDMRETNGIGKQINEKILAHIRRNFLLNFASVEDIYEPTELDKFSGDDLAKFIHHIGLREIALACRGINSKETLAAFLNRFTEENAREIALYITELEIVKPFWVTQADELVRNSWGADLKSEKVLEKISYKLLAMAYVEREETARKYTAQKLLLRDSQKWRKILRAIEKEYLTADGIAKLRIEKRRKMVEKLAITFRQTGRL